MTAQKKAIKGLKILLLLVIVIGIFAIYLAVDRKAPIIYGKVEFNVPYNKNNSLDIYYPTIEPKGKTPLVLFIHGGAWITGSKISINNGRFNGAVKTLRDSGYTIVSMDYTLASEGKSPFPDCIEDGVAATNWLFEKADSLNIDINKFGIFGESAGAHIAMMMTFNDSIKNQIPFEIDYLVDVYGPNKLEGVYHSTLMDSLRNVLSEMPLYIQKRLDLSKTLLGFDPTLDSLKIQKVLKTYSPYYNLNTKAPPSLFVHGNKDILVPPKQTKRLAAKFDTLNLSYEIHLMNGVNHGFIQAKPQQMDSLQIWISEFILRH